VNESPGSAATPPDPETEPQLPEPPPVPPAEEGAPGAVPLAPVPPPPPEFAPGEAAPPPPLEFGGFWIRFGAYVIDALILALIGIPLGLVAGVQSLQSPGELPTWSYLISFLIGVAYFVGFWVRSGSTLGMSALGLQVVRDADGGPITWGKALVRWVGLVISFWILFIGVIWVAFDSRKRGWHDLMAGTVVIRKPNVPITGGRKVLMIGAIGCGCLLPILAILGIVSLLFMGPIIQDIFGDVADDLGRGPDGEITVPMTLTFESLQVGDCFDVLNPDDPSLISLQGIPCSDEHVFEVFFVEDMPDGAFPGDDAIFAFANENCLPAFEDYVGTPFDQSAWYATPLGPGEADWEAGIQRVTCQLHNEGATPVAGSARGSNE
jgi:uncharacterized RDD family membrane protein YckC